MFPFVESTNNLIRILNTYDNKILITIVENLYSSNFKISAVRTNINMEDTGCSVFTENVRMGTMWNSFKYLQGLYYSKENQMLIIITY